MRLPVALSKIASAATRPVIGLPWSVAVGNRAPIMFARFTSPCHPAQSTVTPLAISSASPRSSGSARPIEPPLSTPAVLMPRLTTSNSSTRLAFAPSRGRRIITSTS